MSHLFCLHHRQLPYSPLFPYTTLFRSLFVGLGALPVHALVGPGGVAVPPTHQQIGIVPEHRRVTGGDHHVEGDRKSTRLNSSHVAISYAVFCLKKKRKITHAHRTSFVS